MMGKQVNFYMNLDDQAEMNKIILTSLPSTIILKDNMATQDIEFLVTSEFVMNQSESFRIYFAQREYIGKIIVDPPVKIIVDPFEIRNFINQSVSPVVEYIRCISRPDEKIGPEIQRGRFYYLPEYYINNYTTKIIKDTEFIKYAEKLFRIAKKNLTFNRHDGNYYGAGALADQKNGWRLV
jgi:hypothetical protein